MKGKVISYFKESVRVKNEFFTRNIEEIIQAVEVLRRCLVEEKRCVFVFGNGGSAADSQHFAAELVGRFRKHRRPLPVYALTTNTSTLTAVGNDYSFKEIFRRQLEAFLKPGDVVIAISTSGLSPNVISGVELARKMGACVISLTGKDGGKLKEISDICLVVSSPHTSIIQEVHIMCLHVFSYLIEESLSS